MTMDGVRYTKRTDASRRLQQLTAQMQEALLKSSHRRLEERPGELGGFTVSVTAERVLGSMNVIMALDGAPGTDVRTTPAFRCPLRHTSITRPVSSSARWNRSSPWMRCNDRW